MKKNLPTNVVLTLFAICIAKISFPQNIAINPNGIPPNASAALDIDFTNKGLLIPRVTFAQRTGANFNPLAAVAKGMIVYQNNSGGDGEGFYYNISATTTPSWVKLFAGTSSSGWALTGNGGTTAGTNFIGTTDAVDWVVKANNVEAMRVTSAGKVGIGTTAPASLLHVDGAARLGTASTTSGTLVFNQSASAFTVTVRPSTTPMAASYTLTLPPDDGAANEVLRTNGSGTLSWGNAGSSVLSGTLCGACQDDNDCITFNVPCAGGDPCSPSGCPTGYSRRRIGTTESTTGNFPCNVYSCVKD